MRKIRKFNKHKGAVEHALSCFIFSLAVVLLLFTGCGAFARRNNQTGIPQESFEFLPSSYTEMTGDNPVESQQSQTYGGYTINVKSVVPEGQAVYVTFGLTAPDEVDFSAILNPYSGERLSFQGLLVRPAEVDLPADFLYYAADDGDDRNNTINMILKIDPVEHQKDASGMGAGHAYRIDFTEILRWGYDREYEQELQSTKYIGQTDYMLEPEESDRVHPQTILTSGKWKFEIELPVADEENVELLSAPISTKVMVVRVGASEYETVETIENVTLTSIQVCSSGITVAFEKPEPTEKFDCIYVNAAQFRGAPYVDASEDDAVFLMMKDGTRIDFFQTDGAKDTAFLSADMPIVLREADYIQLPGDIKILISYPQ